MSFRIIILPRAREDVREILVGLSSVSHTAAIQWYNQYRQAVATLRELPERCSPIPEPNIFDIIIRQRLFGKRRKYRIIFGVAGEVVYIFRVRHWAQAPIEPDDFA